MITRRSAPLRRAVTLTGLAAALAGCPQPAPLPPADAALDALDAGETPDAATAQPDDGAPLDTGPPPPSRPAAAPLIRWVDPMIGTGGQGFGVGSAFPGPQRPFGMARPGPDTSAVEGIAPFAHCAGYAYDDVFIEGFSQTRMHGTGISDYGAVGLMPTIGMTPERTTQAGYRSRFSHARETASAGYYAVTLDDTGVRAELTATEHVALHRYTFPAGSDAVVLIDAGHTMSDVRIVDGRVAIDPAAREVAGRARFSGGYSERFGGMNVYFVARFSRPFARHGVWLDGALAPDETTREGARAGAWLAFDATTDARVQVAVGLSFTDEAHARANLDAEAREVDFDRARRDTEQAWETALARVEIEGRTERDFRMFYTALYHALLMPTLASDVDGTYRGIDQAVHAPAAGTPPVRYYTDFSLWDTFRTLHPLLTLLYPERQREMLLSLMTMAREGGGMPRWPLGVGETGGMLGDSADVVFADSWVKGIRDFDVREAYALLRRTAFGPVPAGARVPGRSHITEYLAHGYVPMETGGSSVSKTLEYAYNDAVLAVIADAAGQSADRDALRMRGGNYRNVYDPATRFLVARRADRTFVPVAVPTVWNEAYAEGNAWHYLWYAPHDIEGHAELLGGRATALARLDEFFTQTTRMRVNHVLPGPYYWHGNEPDLHAAWIYSALDAPARTARYSRWILANLYGDGPDGLPGNDDAGTLSAWYLFAASGIYPIAGLDYYLVGSPILTRVRMHLPGGDFVIDAPDASRTEAYVAEAQLDGAPLTRARVPHAAIADGGSLTLRMVAAPTPWAER